MFKIIHKINDGEDNFSALELPNSFHYKKLAVTAMMKLGKETINKQSSKLKKCLKDKERIELLYDKNTEAIAIVIAKKKKPIKILQVWEVLDENKVEEELSKYKDSKGDF